MVERSKPPMIPCSHATFVRFWTDNSNYLFIIRTSRKITTDKVKSMEETIG